MALFEIGTYGLGTAAAVEEFARLLHELGSPGMSRVAERTEAAAEVSREGWSGAAAEAFRERAGKSALYLDRVAQLTTTTAQAVAGFAVMQRWATGELMFAEQLRDRADRVPRTPAYMAAAANWVEVARQREAAARAAVDRAATELAAHLRDLAAWFPRNPGLLEDPGWHLNAFGRNVSTVVSALVDLGLTYGPWRMPFDSWWNDTSAGAERLVSALADLDSPRQVLRTLGMASAFEESAAGWAGQLLAGSGLGMPLLTRARTAVAELRPRWVPDPADVRIQPGNPPMVSLFRHGTQLVADIIEQQLGQGNGMVWLTGQSGAGKGYLTEHLVDSFPGRVVHLEQDWFQHPEAVRKLEVAAQRAKDPQLGSSSWTGQPAEWAGSADSVWNHAEVNRTLNDVRRALDSGQETTVVIEKAWDRVQGAFVRKELTISPDSIVIFDAKYDLYGSPKGRLDDLRFEVANSDENIRNGYIGRTAKNNPDPAVQADKLANFDSVYEPSYKRFRALQEEYRAGIGRDGSIKRPPQPSMIDLVLNNDPAYDYPMSTH